MKVLIIEDEMPAARRLVRMLESIDPGIVILAILDSVKSSKEWLAQNPSPELIFLDIHLADGRSTEVFGDIPMQVPVIFTTAYDSYAIRAFELNSIDYLMKPIEVEAIKSAIRKLEQLKTTGAHMKRDLADRLDELLNMSRYKDRFLLKSGEKFFSIKVEEIALFYSEDGYSFILSANGKKLIYDATLDKIYSELNPKYFFRINRKIIANKEFINDLQSYANHRLVFDIKGLECVVSRDKVKPFKKWLEHS
ncbi:MAG: LytTR family DNA-binding domain-containing protein [Flavobacteriales bacterium]|nr:LytTR family DNA-binding domain-containing protein [Flavobacteriales bacterium]